MKEYIIKYPRMFIDLLAVLTSLVLIIILINIFGLNVYAKDIKSWDPTVAPYQTGDVFGEDGAAASSFDFVVDPLSYDSQHYDDLVSEGDSNITYYANYKNINDLNVSINFYDPTIVDGGLNTDYYVPVSGSDFSLIMGSSSGINSVLFFKMSSTYQKFYMINGIIVSDNLFYCWRINATTTTHY